MQRDFNNRDFEQFVKQNADQYRMFPSEKVWQGINNALHTRRRWYGFGLAFLLLLTGTAVTLVMVSTPENKQPDNTAVTVPASTLDQGNESTSANTIQRKRPAPANPALTPIDVPLTPQTEGVFSSEPVTLASTIDLVAAKTEEQPMEKAATASLPVSVYPTVTAPAAMNAPVTQLNDMAIAVTRGSVNGISSDVPVAVNTNTQETPKQTQPETINSEPRKESDIYPMTIESVVNSYRPVVRRQTFSLQFYIAPTISYRKLSENKKFLQSAADNGMVPVYAAYSDVNNYVSHKPDMGLELGFAGKYALTERFSIKGGLQFNVSRYDIKAAYDQRRESATIALDGGNFGTNQTITRQTNYRNFNGNDPSNWLKNLYYSVSLPLGAELTFNSRTNSHFGIAATFQPTYVIKDRAYLISTDYKNYLEVPSLVRKINMNTSFETFIAYSTRNIKWQVGPQVRYQIQSSFSKKYPFKENLFDFGLKVGIQLNR